MKVRERRALLVIEKNLLAETPELAALFGPLSRPHRSRAIQRAAQWCTAGLLLLSTLLSDGTVALGALALLSMSVVRWTVVEADAYAAELDGRPS
jgi:hypothetical protein